MSHGDEVKRLEQQISVYLPNVNRLKESLNAGEKSNPNRDFYPKITIKNLDLSNIDVLNISILFDLLTKSLLRYPSIIPIVKQNLVNSMDINLVKIALDILSSQVDRDISDQKIQEILTTLRLRCATPFIEEYVLRLRKPTALGVEIDEYLSVFLLHSRSNIELHYLNAVSHILCAAEGVVKYRSEAFQLKLSKTFGGVGVADEIVDQINNIVNGFIDFDKSSIIDAMNSHEEYIRELRYELRYLKNLISEFGKQKA